MIPIAQPELGDEEIHGVTRVLSSGMLAQGPQVMHFEKDFSRYSGVNHAVAVNNGTAALHTALACLGIQPGDEVIVPSFTFFATASSVCMTGARPVFADVSKDTFNIDPKSVASLIGPRTVAVIGVHLFGQPCAARSLQELCTDHGLFFVEDAAQAHGAEFHHKKVGSLGDAACFSFYPTKNMTTGEGGMVTTNDADLARRMRIFINHGQSEKYLHTMIGYNYRMTDIAGAIGRTQMEKIDAMNRRRSENGTYYSRHIHCTGVVNPVTSPGATHVYHQYVLRITPECPLSRDELVRHLHANGIGTAIHYPIPLHKQPALLSYAGAGPCPNAGDLAREVLSIPVHPRVTDEQRRFVCETINGVS